MAGGAGARRITANRPGSKLDRAALRGWSLLASREMALCQQARMLARHPAADAATRHIAHRPFAVAALVAVVVHVGVVVAMGMTWLCLFW
ncbi:MAG: hypothetical protein R2882_09325 [Gemmatimonadales bacterium]